MEARGIWWSLQSLVAMTSVRGMLLASGGHRPGRLLGRQPTAYSSGLLPPQRATQPKMSTVPGLRKASQT